MSVERFKEIIAKAEQWLDDYPYTIWIVISLVALLLFGWKGVFIVGGGLAALVAYLFYKMDKDID